MYTWIVWFICVQIAIEQRSRKSTLSVSLKSSYLLEGKKYELNFALVPWQLWITVSWFAEEMHVASTEKQNRKFCVHNFSITPFYQASPEYLIYACAWAYTY